jgi:hypothetical protein
MIRAIDQELAATRAAQMIPLLPDHGKPCVSALTGVEGCPKPECEFVLTAIEQNSDGASAVVMA